MGLPAHLSPVLPMAVMSSTVSTSPHVLSCTCISSSIAVKMAIYCMSMSGEWSICVTLIVSLLAHEYPTGPENNQDIIALYIAALVVIIIAVIRLLVELVQLVQTRCHYFLTAENYIELVAYFSSIIFVSNFGNNCWCPTNWQWQLGAIAVFLAWINFILFLQRVPLLGIYVLMFSSILYTFLKFALIAFLFVMAFCLSFYMILYKAVSVTAGWDILCVYVCRCTP